MTRDRPGLPLDCVWDSELPAESWGEALNDPADEFSEFEKRVMRNAGIPVADTQPQEDDGDSYTFQSSDG